MTKHFQNIPVPKFMTGLAAVEKLNPPPDPPAAGVAAAAAPKLKPPGAGAAAGAAAPPKLKAGAAEGAADGAVACPKLKVGFAAVEKARKKFSATVFRAYGKTAHRSIIYVL